MKITLEDISISFYQRRIIKNLHFVFDEHDVYAVTGNNGSGKSTIIKLIAGLLKPSRGTIVYLLDHKNLVQEMVYRHIGWVAPYINIYEELNACEAYRFHKKFKRPLLTEDEFLKMT
ncbi:MAG TPA: ATP-binding cassette domain-containing protein, partial [Cytophagales bacterium]|nr:ATP-binding cassette domain-containing protein [Cytophagales bacterium]